MLLGALGVYGVTTLIASQRTHEMGVRIALGARPGDIAGIALRSGLLAPGLGMAAGLVVAVMLSRFLVAFLATVSPLDPLVFGTVAIALPAIAAAAAWVPARRVARLDPVSTLRGD
jgi:ABC-type antimicrobial peptide transport system permease subunit